MALGLYGRNAVPVRPDPDLPATPGVAPQNLWAKNRSANGANDGYEFCQTDLNEIIGQLRTLLVAIGGDLNGTVGNELAVAIVAALDAKRSIADELFLGSFADLAALQAAHPEGAAGQWAILQRGSGTNASTALWDSDNTVPAWVDSGVVPSTLDWTAITNKPAQISDNPTAITDWNAALLPGWYRFANGAASQPVGGWNWGALVLPGINGNNQLQFGFAQNNSGVQFYMRERNFTVWSSWLKLALTQAEQDGRYLKLSGGALTNGISFGSNFGASNTDLSKHLALYSTTYGFGVTSNRLNAVLPSSAGWYVNIGGTDYLTVTSALLKYGTNDIWHAGNKASAAEIRSATSGKGIDPANVFAANAWVPVAYAANMAIDQSTGFHFTTTLTGDTALVAMTNKKQQAGYFEIKQDATGGRAITSYSTDFFLPGGTPTIDTAPNARNMFVYATLADNKVMLIYMGSD